MSPSIHSSKEIITPFVSTSTSSSSSFQSSSQLLAMKKYTEGILLEKQGSLSQAFTCFQQAFKLDPDVDITYTYQKRRKSSLINSVADADDEDEESNGGADHVTSTTVSSTLLSIDDCIQNIGQDALSYKPLKKSKSVWIVKLPGEVIVHILCHLVIQSLGSIAQFALVCKPFFLLTRSPTLWRFACSYLFCKSDMTLMESRQQQLSLIDNYQNRWMYMIKVRPRVRYDGVYIATCQYVRPGEASDSAWTRPVHLVTYYRYLRFFPDGRVLNFISNEEPIKVIHSLVSSSSHRRQLFRGTFVWDGKSKVLIRVKEDMRQDEEFMINLTINHPYSEICPGKIKTTKRRPYKLTWDSYTSRKVVGVEQINTYDLKFMKPFIFSAVNSYRVEF
ncbi:hypothetical protein BCR42DRAFT_445115 [Absidia repens]|uniref:F-box domain-containing protein n=1 Tax=Absidia repens TaxID=90262 RepID=A0A1X2J0H4_9FUNG|nr:hypothetical protein BCR42DRAFT_445115 [Absidia repens]